MNVRQKLKKKKEIHALFLMLALVLKLNRYFEIPLSVQSRRGFRGGGGVH